MTTTNDHVALERVRLIARAIIRYEFRPPTLDEPPGDYLRALLTHVHQRDWAAAFEIRIGRAQADWTPADAVAFKDHLQGRPTPTFELSPGVHAVPAMEDPGHPATVEELERVAAAMMDTFVAQRVAHPAKELAVLAVVLLTMGTLVTLLPDSDERVGLIKTLARTKPVFGWIVGCDAFVHAIDTVPGKETATKRDAFIVHSGSRDHRVMRIRRYVVVEGGVQFDLPEAHDLRHEMGPRSQDPYADVFVTVPPATSVS